MTTGEIRYETSIPSQLIDSVYTAVWSGAYLRQIWLKVYLLQCRDTAGLVADTGHWHREDLAVNMTTLAEKQKVAE